MAESREYATPRVPDLETAWPTEETWWREHFRARPFARPDAEFEHYREALRYGWEAAHRHAPGLAWRDVAPDMQRGWSDWPHRGGDLPGWDEVRDAARDAWEQVRGEPRIPHSKR